eukprot:Clim_evm18s6 gene=Clim_evmTU18s6
MSDPVSFAVHQDIDLSDKVQVAPNQSKRQRRPRSSILKVPKSDRAALGEVDQNTDTPSKAAQRKQEQKNRRVSFAPRQEFREYVTNAAEWNSPTATDSTGDKTVPSQPHAPQPAQVEPLDVNDHTGDLSSEFSNSISGPALGAFALRAVAAANKRNEAEAEEDDNDVDMEMTGEISISMEPPTLLGQQPAEEEADDTHEVSMEMTINATDAIARAALQQQRVDDTREVSMDMTNMNAPEDDAVEQDMDEETITTGLVLRKQPEGDLQDATVTEIQRGEETAGQTTVFFLGGHHNEDIGLLGEEEPADFNKMSRLSLDPSTSLRLATPQRQALRKERTSTPRMQQHQQASQRTPIPVGVPKDVKEATEIFAPRRCLARSPVKGGSQQAMPTPQPQKMAPAPVRQPATAPRPVVEKMAPVQPAPVTPVPARMELPRQTVPAPTPVAMPMERPPPAAAIAPQAPKTPQSAQKQRLDSAPATPAAGDVTDDLTNTGTHIRQPLMFRDDLITQEMPNPSQFLITAATAPSMTSTEMEAELIDIDVALQDFWYESGVRFWDNMNMRRRTTMMGGKITLRGNADKFRVACLTIRELSWYDMACKSISHAHEQLKKDVAVMTRNIEGNAPRIMRLTMALAAADDADSEEALQTLQHTFTALKTSLRTEVRMQWYQWRTEFERGLQQVLREQIQTLQQGLFHLTTLNGEVSMEARRLENHYRETIQKLQENPMKHMDEAQIEKLVNHQKAVQEVGQAIETKRSEVQNLKAEHADLDERMQRLEKVTSQKTENLTNLINSLSQDVTEETLAAAQKARDSMDHAVPWSLHIRGADMPTFKWMENQLSLTFSLQDNRFEIEYVDTHCTPAEAALMRCLASSQTRRAIDDGFRGKGWAPKILKRFELVLGRGHDLIDEAEQCSMLTNVTVRQFDGPVLRTTFLVDHALSSVAPATEVHIDFNVYEYPYIAPAVSANSFGTRQAPIHREEALVRSIHELNAGFNYLQRVHNAILSHFRHV